ncbi:hypothetical protein [Maribacter sp. 2307ULW6-5]|uniref:hypothetical protein n=1 Tax=Maribacter sp. 2307ULW6-5 TaxID=3386275 RepID=UPI0039BCADB8
MKNKTDKGPLKASESAPMETKQKNGDGVHNQTTEVPKKRFPWALIGLVTLFLILLAVILFFLGGLTQ